VLFSPEAHERLTGDGWSADRARAAIAGIAAHAESTFDGGWSMHPDDVEKGDDPATRFRTVYLGGAGVVDALHRLAQRGFVELRRDYVSYLERSLESPPDFPDDDAERSLLTISAAAYPCPRANSTSSRSCDADLRRRRGVEV
jgi:hypothetical protein